jgi:hypothetical protein
MNRPVSYFKVLNGKHKGLPVQPFRLKANDVGCTMTGVSSTLYKRIMPSPARTGTRR